MPAFVSYIAVRSDDMVSRKVSSSGKNEILIFPCSFLGFIECDNLSLWITIYNE